MDNDTHCHHRVKQGISLAQNKAGQDGEKPLALTLRHQANRVRYDEPCTAEREGTGAAPYKEGGAASADKR